MTDRSNGTGAGDGDYGALLDAVKREITRSRVRGAALAADVELIRQYWRIGRLILHRQPDDQWGRMAVPRLSADLRGAFPEAVGYSRTNLRYMRAFAAAWPDGVPPTGRPIPWGHHIVLLDMLDNRATREFYARKTADEGWTRGVLITMIKGRLHLRIRHAPHRMSRMSPSDRRSVQRLVRESRFPGLTGEDALHEGGAGAPALSENSRRG
ncbi:hypothetical protein GCM10010517_12220 [Streptosporangium fragile]|uniref:YhcG N-terminal domain-containing protein n=1 Tax=Streptosporangium fragile TaxID=46186 RepID=A0ABN3VRN9_9ACTN